MRSSPRLPRRLAASVALALTVAVPLGLHAARATAGQGALRAGRHRAMHVSAVDRDGRPVTDLAVSDFVVREDGMAREVLTAERASGPVTIALLVDNTAAATRLVPDFRTALAAFARRMSGRNPMAVMTFADRPVILQDYTLVAPQVARAIERIFPVPGSGACLLQALKEASTGLARRDFERAAIIAITTEGPEFSDLEEDQVVPFLRASGAAMHAFVFRASTPQDLRDQGTRSRAAVLDAGPRETGGRRAELLTSMALEQALDALADQLTHQYRITYARPEALIPPERIEVAVTRPGVESRGTPVRPGRE